jgi:hypothetical protein
LLRLSHPASRACAQERRLLVAACDQAPAARAEAAFAGRPLPFDPKIVDRIRE